MLDYNSQSTSVFIFTGQSNSLGTTSLEGTDCGPGFCIADANIRFAWSNVNASNTTYPPEISDSSNGKFYPLQMQKGENADPYFWGPEFGFARAMYDAGWKRLIIIKSSRGGGGNTYWSEKAFLEDKGRGHMWGHLVEVILMALNQLRKNSEKFLIRGFMYLQGESNNSSESQLAGLRLEELIDGLNLCINRIFPGTSLHMRSFIAEIAASKSNAERLTTVRQHKALAVRRQDLSFVPTHDLPLKNDALHFGSAAKLEIGRRFAHSFLSSCK